MSVTDDLLDSLTRDLTLKDKCFRVIHGLLKDGCRFAERGGVGGNTQEINTQEGALKSGVLIATDPILKRYVRDARRVLAKIEPPAVRERS